jgi:hypothetical protein
VCAIVVGSALVLLRVLECGGLLQGGENRRYGFTTFSPLQFRVRGFVDGLAILYSKVLGNTVHCFTSRSNSVTAGSGFHNIYQNLVVQSRG